MRIFRPLRPQNRALLPALTLALGFLLNSGTPLHAASGAGSSHDPFDVDQQGWMSLERYSDKEQRFPQLMKKEEPAPEKTAAPKDAATGPVAPAEPAAKAEAPPPDPAALAEAARKAAEAEAIARLKLPVLPAAKDAFNLQINSTAEENASAAQVMDISTAPKLVLPESNWQDPTTTAGEGNDANDPKNPLNVRLAGLPDTRVAPVPAGPVTKKPEKVAAALPPPPPPKKESQACAAISAERKRVLDAIESDRRTLSALQNAIKSLGLESKLNFMTDATGSLNTSSTGEAIDLPPSRTSPAPPSKNP